VESKREEKGERKLERENAQRREGKEEEVGKKGTR
jgi:hypothetical protein